MSTRLSANDPALTPFLTKAVENVAKVFGLTTLDEVQQKALSINIYREAVKLYSAEHPKKTASPVVDRGAAFMKMLQRAFGYAIKYGVAKETWVDTVQKAINDPIAPTERKPRNSESAA